MRGRRPSPAPPASHRLLCCGWGAAAGSGAGGGEADDGAVLIRARGTAPSAWPDSHGFLNKPADGTTGLDMVGARAYDPVTGRFLSRDSVFESNDPTQLGGYAYAGDSPASFSDPTGLTKCDIEPELCSARIQELSAERDAAQAKSDQAYADSVESDQIDRCHSGMCEQKVAKNWQDPAYAQQQVVNSFAEAEAQGEVRAQEATAAAAQAQAKAEADKHKCHGWFCGIEHAVGAVVHDAKGVLDVANAAAPFLDVAAATLFWVPGAGEVLVGAALVVNQMAAMDAAVNLASDVAHGGVGALSQKNTYLDAASVGLNLVGASLARKALSSSLKLGAARVAGSALKRSRKALQIAQDKAIQRSYVFNQANIGASEGDNVLEGSRNPIAVARQYSWENPF